LETSEERRAGLEKAAKMFEIDLDDALHRVTAATEEASQLRRSLVAEKAERQAEASTASASTQELRERCQRAEKQVEELKATLAETNTAKRHLEGKDKQVERLQSMLEEEEDKCRAATSRAAAAEVRLQALERSLEDQERAAAATAATLQEQLDHVAKRLASERASESTTVAELEGELDKERSECLRLRVELESRDADVEKIEQTFSEQREVLEADAKTARDEVFELRRENHRMKFQLATVEQEKDGAVESTRRELQRQITEDQRQHDLITDKMRYQLMEAEKRAAQLEATRASEVSRLTVKLRQMEDRFNKPQPEPPKPLRSDAATGITPRFSAPKLETGEREQEPRSDTREASPGGLTVSSSSVPQSHQSHTGSPEKDSSLAVSAAGDVPSRSQMSASLDSGRIRPVPRPSTEATGEIATPARARPAAQPQPPSHPPPPAPQPHPPSHPPPPLALGREESERSGGSVEHAAVVPAVARRSVAHRRLAMDDLGNIWLDPSGDGGRGSSPNRSVSPFSLASASVPRERALTPPLRFGHDESSLLVDERSRVLSTSLSAVPAARRISRRPESSSVSRAHAMSHAQPRPESASVSRAEAMARAPGPGPVAPVPAHDVAQEDAAALSRRWRRPPDEVEKLLSEALAVAQTESLAAMQSGQGLDPRREAEIVALSKQLDSIRKALRTDVSRGGTSLEQSRAESERSSDAGTARESSNVFGFALDARNLAEREAAWSWERQRQAAWERSQESGGAQDDTPRDTEDSIAPAQRTSPLHFRPQNPAWQRQYVRRTSPHSPLASMTQPSLEDYLDSSEQEPHPWTQQPPPRAQQQQQQHQDAQQDPRRGVWPPDGITL